MNREIRELAGEALLEYSKVGKEGLTGWIRRHNESIMRELRESSGQPRGTFWHEYGNDVMVKVSKGPKYSNLIARILELSQQFRDDSDTDNDHSGTQVERLARFKRNLERINRYIYNPYELLEAYTMKFGRGYVLSDNFLPNLINSVNAGKPPKIQHLDCRGDVIELALIAGQSLRLDQDYAKFSGLFKWNMMGERQAASILNHRISVPKNTDNSGLIEDSCFSLAWMMEHGMVLGDTDLADVSNDTVVYAAALDKNDTYRHIADKIIADAPDMPFKPKFKLLRALVTGNFQELEEMVDDKQPEIAASAIFALDGRGIERSKNYLCYYARMILGTHDVNMSMNPDTDIPDSSMDDYGLNSTTMCGRIAGDYDDTLPIYGYNLLHTMEVPDNLTPVEEILVKGVKDLITQIRENAPSFIRRPRTIILDPIDMGGKDAAK
jgi:hypothetical protein